MLWFRVLVIFLRPTTYSFTLMLGTVLAGIALGSYIASPILKRGRNLVAWLAGIELGIAVLALSSFQGLGLTVYSMDWLRATLTGSPVLAYLSPLLVAQPARDPPDRRCCSAWRSRSACACGPVPPPTTVERRSWPASSTR